MIGTHSSIQDTQSMSLHLQGQSISCKGFSFLLPRLETSEVRASQSVTFRFSVVLFLGDGKCCCLATMGTCSSAQKKTDSTAKASHGVCFRAKDPSPIKAKALNEENPVNLLGVMSPEFGSKEETFFDSKVWLDTDCEDEFLSVNGDFTPSRCSSSNYESIKVMTPRKSMSLEIFLSSKPEPSPTGRKKLAELLWETSQGEKTTNDEQQSDSNSYKNRNFKLVQSSLHGHVYASEDGSVVPCCLPSLVQTDSFSEKRKMNPLYCCA